MWGLFSQREGHKPVRNEIQIEGMDIGTRNRLWSALYDYYFAIWRENEYRYSNSELPRILWLWYFKLPIDRLPSDSQLFIENVVRNHFYSCEWFELLDFIEAVQRISQDSHTNAKFTEYCNLILETESYGYRLVSGNFVRNIEGEEINEIEDAMKSAPDLVKAHISQSLRHLSNRNNPDYRNSIKESISALETLCRQITGKRRVTLGEALSEIERKGIINFHPAFRQACNKLYGWTSDEDGVRHSLMDESDLSQEDARFMLVACSSFANYLIVKADKAGIELR